MPSRKKRDVFEVSISIKLVSIILLAFILIFFVKAFFTHGEFDGPGVYMQLASVSWFFIVSWGIGASATKLLHLDLNVGFIEGFFTNIGFGLALFPILSVIMNFMGIPLNWFVYLMLALCVPLAYAARSLNKYSTKGLQGFSRYVKNKLDATFNSWDGIRFLASVFFASILFYVLVFGAFRYAWLEDGDPWEHASSAKYVSLFNTYSVPADMYVAHYLEPYPPAYATLMGVTHQLNSRISWTLKFFNSLIICLGIVFFFIFVKKLSGSSQLAFYSSFFLAIANSYSSHFIWAQAYNVAIFYPAFYAILSVKDDKKWFSMAFLITASTLLIQPTTSVMFGVYLISYFILMSLMEKKFQKRIFLTGLIGFILAMNFFWIPTILKFGLDNSMIIITTGGVEKTHWDLSFLKGGSSDTFNRFYHLNEFVHAADPTHIPQPTGLGEVYFGLFLFSIIFFLTSKEKEGYMVIVACWFFIALIALESTVLPLTLRSTRNWTNIAVFSAILCGKGIMVISTNLKDYPLSRAMIILFILIGVFATTGVTKYKVQTSIWPMGSKWISDPQFRTYLNLKSLPPNTPVYSACFSDDFVIGFDMMSHPWDKELVDLKENKLPYVSPQEFHSLLVGHGFQFLIYDISCIDKCDRKPDSSMCLLRWEDLIDELVSSGFFEIIHTSSDTIVFRVN